MTSEVGMRFKLGTQSDRDAAARGDGAELPVPVRRSSTLDGLLNGFADLTDAVARRPPTLRAGSRHGAEDLVVPEERPVDPARVADAKWKAYASRNPTVVTKPSPLAPHLEERRARGLTRWERFCDAVRERPNWMDIAAIATGVLMMLFSIGFLAYAIRVAGI